MTAEESFITSIISQAIEDCAYTGINHKNIKFKKEAINWIVGMDPEFVNYCKMLAMDPDTIRNKVLTHINMSYTQKQKFRMKEKGISL